MNRSLKNIINLSNSIIGVSILAMPLCFKQCGIILALFIISFSALLNYFSCYLLLKSAIINRRRNYELLSYDVFGNGGKTLVEICLLLYLLGTCVAFFVIVGDIASSLIVHIFEFEQGPHIRALCMTILAMFIILPLGLLRDVNNLTSFSMMSLIVYLFLALRMLYLSLDNILLLPSTTIQHTPQSTMIVNNINNDDSILQHLNYWNSSYFITYLPIFSMALSCQSQLFEIFNQELYQTNKNGSSLRLIMRSIKRAIIICSFVYIIIGCTGYIAFYNINFTGNILKNLPVGFITRLTLLLFLITILTSFPLCLFPCRTSFHSLLFRKGIHYDLLSTSHSSIHMSDYQFKLITILLIITTMGISIIFPRIELILALIGSTIGSLICLIIPALIFIKICDKNTVEYLLSYLLLFFGTVILVFCTMSALHNISMARNQEIEDKINEFKLQQQQKSVINVPKIIKMDDKQQPKSSTPTMDMKSRIKNINKLKESIKNDINRLKKQESILKHLEQQQQHQLQQQQPTPQQKIQQHPLKLIQNQTIASATKSMMIDGQSKLLKNQSLSQSQLPQSMQQQSQQQQMQSKLQQPPVNIISNKQLKLTNNNQSIVLNVTNNSSTLIIIAAANISNYNNNSNNLKMKEPTKLINQSKSKPPQSLPMINYNNNNDDNQNMMINVDKIKTNNHHQQQQLQNQNNRNNSINNSIYSYSNKQQSNETNVFKNNNNNNNNGQRPLSL